MPANCSLLFRTSGVLCHRAYGLRGYSNQVCVLSRLLFAHPRLHDWCPLGSTSQARLHVQGSLPACKHCSPATHHVAGTCAASLYFNACNAIDGKSIRCGCVVCDRLVPPTCMQAQRPLASLLVSRRDCLLALQTAVNFRHTNTARPAQHQVCLWLCAVVAAIAPSYMG